MTPEQLERAACRDMPTAVFFSNYTDHAKAICAGCPVAEPCAASADGLAYGVFGGRSPADRGFVHQRPLVEPGPAISELVMGIVSRHERRMFTARQIADWLPGYSRDSVRQALKRLVDNGTLEVARATSPSSPNYYRVQLREAS